MFGGFDVARRLARLLFAVCACFGGAALAADIQVSEYRFAPDPVANSGTATFSIRLTNNGPQTVADARLAIAISSRFQVGAADFPAYCAVTGSVGAQTVNCNLPTLAVGSMTLTYTATARQIGSADTTATISSVSANDPNMSNNSLTITPAVVNGADLTVAKADNLPGHRTASGSPISYTLVANNAGPAATSAVRLTDNLPADEDFELISASGAGWSCGTGGQVVTCDYGGAAVLGSYAPVTITGRVVSATTGTITNNAFVALNSPLVGDPHPDNNAAPPVVTTIDPGSDLAAVKSMPSRIALGETVTVTIGVHNVGPQDVNGAIVTDAVPPSLTVASVPAGCTLSGQTVTCTTAYLPQGATQTFGFTATGATVTNGSAANYAQSAPPAGVADPNPSNDQAMVLYQVQGSGADLAILKRKTPSLVSPGDLLHSDITIVNNGPGSVSFTPAAPLRVVDTVTADETFQFTNNGWTCGQTGLQIVCTLPGPGILQAGGSQYLSLFTAAGSTANGPLTNTACTGTTGGSTAPPADPNPANDCASSTVSVSPAQADLSIDKTVSLSPGSGFTHGVLTVPGTAASFYIRLVATNRGAVPSTARVTDPIAGNYSGAAGNSGYSIVDPSGAAIAPGNVAFGADGLVTWDVGTLAANASATLIVKVTRPLDGSSATLTNTATIASTDVVDPDPSNDSSSAGYVIQPVTDVAVTQKSLSPNPAQVGVVSTYTISTRNNGPNEAAGVTLTDTIDTSRFDLVGQPSTTKGDGSCSLATGASSATITCALGTYPPDTSYQVLQQVRPRFPFGGSTSFPQSYTNHATIATGSTETDATNNEGSVTHDVIAPTLDLSITKQEPGPQYDPVTFGEELVYDIRLSNFGPSQANNVVVVDTPQPPSGYTMSVAGYSVNPVAASSGLSLYTPPHPDCTASGATIVCRLDSTSAANNYLNPLYQTIFRVRFTVVGPAPGGSLTFSDSAAITASEQPTTTTTLGDPQLANNVATQTTTVLPASDLEVVSKTRISGSPAAVDAPIEYRIVIRNNGPSPTNQVRVTDDLPPGFVLATPIATATGQGTSEVTAISCADSGTAQLLCILDGTFSPDGSPVTITLRVKAAAPYAGARGTDLTNVATIGPGIDPGGNPRTVDAISTNNSKTATVQIASDSASTIAGYIFLDANGDNQVQPGEGMAGVTVTLGGTNASNIPVGPLTTVTNASGYFSFAGLDPGTYSLVETQPSGVLDGRETAGSAGGTPDNTAYDTSAQHNSVSGIALAAATTATGYLFQELPAAATASLSGRVFADANNDNAVQSGEGLAGVTVTLNGVDPGNNALPPRTATTDADGTYQFSGLAPGTYSLVEAQPSAYFDGRETAGSAGGVANNAAFGNAALTNSISGIVLSVGTAATGYLFQDLPPASVSGSIYRDANNNGTRDAGETGFAPASFASSPQLRLTGTDYAGHVVNLTATVDGNGTYNLTALPPSDATGYTVTELVEPAGTLDGLDRNGATLVPNSAGRTAPEGIAIGAVAPGAVLASRDFGELPGLSLAGSIYLDTNGDATRQGTETGLGGGVVRLTGTDDLGQAVDCSMTTGGDGTFSFPSGLAATFACRTLRPGTYTLTEMPPAGFAHTGLFIGTAGGSAGGVSGANRSAPGAGNLAVGGIVLVSGAATAYDFGERGQGLAGYVYLDRNDNGLRDAGEFGIAGVRVTLSGHAGDGRDICAVTSCVATTAGNGSFAFANLPSSDAAGYTLTEQPQTQAPLTLYGDGQDGVGTVGGAPHGAAGNDVVSGILLAAGELGADYRFGERAGSLAGHVFVDANDDGQFQPGETAIAGVTLTLSGTTSAGQEICAQRGAQSPALPCTTVTGSDGAYGFADLPAGTYGVTETQPPAYTDGKEGAGSPAGTVNNAAFGASAATNRIAGIAFGGGIAGAGYDFGERNVSIGGRVFKDPQRDGIDSGGEPGIAGVTVRLLQNGQLVATATTGADGSYSFSGLQLGSYTVKEDQPAGYGSSSPDSVDVTLDGSARTVSFGEAVSTLAGAVFVDTSNDGVRQPGERGIAGAVVTLAGTDQAGAAVTRTATTDADGAFRFDDLLAGTYMLSEAQPAGYADGLDSAGSAGGTVGNDAIAAILLPAGIDAARYAFGERGQGIGGVVYIDANDNATRDAGEAPIAGVAVTLQRPDGSVVATAITGPDGSYAFANLDLGAYLVVETQPAGFGEGRENSADRVAVTLGATPLPPVNFGERRPQALGGTVYVDANLNGRFDSGDTGIGGVTVAVQKPEGTVVATTVTSADGTYRFSALDPGAYIVVETQPAGYLDAAENPSNRVPATVDATGPPTINFGERGQSLGGIVYVDANLNGTRDTGEGGIGGVTITLQKPDGTVVATTKTAADGSYGFAGLATGDYVVLETQPAGYGDAAENASNRVAIAIGAAATAPVNFGEKTGSIAGLVYDDSNFNGRRDPNEPAIRGVTLTLAGTDSLGNAVNLSAVTGIDGTYRITGVPGGSYRLIETQPAGYEDERDTPGTAGGIAAPVPGDTISSIALGPAQDATGYLFGERGQGAQLSGSVWFDANHDGVRQGNEPGKPGWIVQLLLGDLVVASATTDANGYYRFDDLPPGTGYSLMFREPASAVAFGGAKPNESGLPASDGVFSTGNPGGATFTVGQLRSITLTPGANLQQQSLPLDPSGILFDPVNCTAIAGATVTFSGPPGFDPALHLLGGAANASQVTGAEGFYQFLLLPGAPSGVYSLSVKAPPGGIYSSVAPSTRFPAQPGVLQVGPLPNPLLVSPSAPSCRIGDPAPYYYLSFNLTGGYSADVLNNNIPLDPILKGAIVVTKTTPMKNVTRGGLVPYTVTARNALGGVVPNIAVVDNVPAGFRYRDGSARVNGVPVVPVVNGRQLVFPAASFAINETRTIDLILTVGAGVGEGEHVNQAWASNANANTLVSNVAEATVRLEPDADFDCSDIIGKVFDDRNGNGYEDAGERGLAGVRVATVAGDLITTDAEGRYHVTCPMIPNEDRGSNFILKLDTRTLPTGYRMTSENPQTIRLTRGKAAKLNFGAALLRVVRLDVRDTVFSGDEVAADYVAKVDGLVATLEGEPSVLRIVYTAHGEAAPVASRRIAAMRALVERKWGERKGRYRLIVETEQAP